MFKSLFAAIAIGQNMNMSPFRRNCLCGSAKTILLFLLLGILQNYHVLHNYTEFEKTGLFGRIKQIKFVDKEIIQIQKALTWLSIIYISILVRSMFLETGK